MSMGMMSVKEYHRPENLEEAIRLLSDLGDSARIIAGGTDVMVKLKNGKISAEHLVSLDCVPGIRGINLTTDGKIRIGAATLMSELEQDENVKKYAAVLAEAAGTVGCNSIRNRATIGGNIVNASPVSDTIPAVIVLGGTIEITGPEGIRCEEADTFFQGLGKTTLLKNEVVTAVYIPIRERQGSTYLKFGRRNAMELAIVSAACAISMAEDGTCNYAKMAIGAVTPKPTMLEEFETGMMGRGLAEIDEAFLDVMGEKASQAVSPRSSTRATAEYKKKTAGVLARRAGEAVWKQVLENV